MRFSPPQAASSPCHRRPDRDRGAADARAASRRAPGSEPRLGALHSVLFLAVCLAACLVGGCGYALVGQASNLPDDVREIYVEPLENETPRSQVEQILTEAIIDELVTRRRFSVVNDRAAADAVLRGEIVEFRLRALTFDQSGLADNFEISITGDMRLERQPLEGEDEGEVLWQNARYVFREDYPVDDTGLSFFDRENIAIEETAEAFAETLVTDLLEGF